MWNGLSQGGAGDRRLSVPDTWLLSPYAPATNQDSQGGAQPGAGQEVGWRGRGEEVTSYLKKIKLLKCNHCVGQINCLHIWPDPVPLKVLFPLHVDTGTPYCLIAAICKYL